MSFVSESAFSIMSQDQFLFGFTNAKVNNKKKQHQNHLNCSKCREHLPRLAFSNNQWRKGKVGDNARCAACLGNAAPPRLAFPPAATRLPTASTKTAGASTKGPSLGGKVARRLWFALENTFEERIKSQPDDGQCIADEMDDWLENLKSAGDMAEGTVFNSALNNGKTVLWKDRKTWTKKNWNSLIRAEPAGVYELMLTLAFANQEESDTDIIRLWVDGKSQQLRTALAIYEDKLKILQTTKRKSSAVQRDTEPQSKKTKRENTPQTSETSSSSSSSSPSLKDSDEPWQLWINRHFKVTGMTEIEKTTVAEVVKEHLAVIGRQGKFYTTDWSVEPLLLPSHLLEQEKDDSKQTRNPPIVNKIQPAGERRTINVPTDAPTIESAMQLCATIRNEKGNAAAPITIQLGEGDYEIKCSWTDPSDNKAEVEKSTLDVLHNHIRFVGVGVGKTSIKGTLLIHHHYGIEFQDLTVSNIHGYGIWSLGKGSTVKAVQCKFDSCQSQGARIDNGSSFDAELCHFSNNKNIGALVSDPGSTGTFRNCKFYNNGGMAGIWSCDDAVVDLYGDETEIYNNVNGGLLATHKTVTGGLMNVHLPSSRNISHNNAENGDGAPEHGKKLLVAMAPMFNVQAYQGGTITFSCGKTVTKEGPSSEGCVIC